MIQQIKIFWNVFHFYYTRLISGPLIWCKTRTSIQFYRDLKPTIKKTIHYLYLFRNLNSPDLLRQPILNFHQIIFAIWNYIPASLLFCRQNKVDNCFWILGLITSMHFKEFRSSQYSNTLYTSITATDVVSYSKLH